MSRFLSYLRNLNIFQSDIDNDEYHHQYQSNLIATRVYLILLILGILSLTVSLSLIPQTTTKILYYPTVEQVKTLPLDVQCPCSRLSVSYGTFLTLDGRLHQICSSDFITDRWIKAIYSGRNSTYFYQGDFRGIGSAQFQFLVNLCNLSKSNIDQGLSLFYDTSLISSQVLLEDFLRATIKVSIEQFNTTVPFTFKSQLDLIHKLIFGNQLTPGLRTTLNIDYINNNQSKILANYLSYKSSNTTSNRCVTDYNIGVPSGIYNVTENETIFLDSDDQNKLLFHIPGLFSGCTPTHSFLQSTFECFYNQTCINQILSYLSTNETFTAMNSTKQTIFSLKSSVQSIVNHIMVEEWISNISYEKYFIQCAPFTCTYSKAERREFRFVIIEVIGLLGGLLLVLGISIPNIIRLIKKPKVKKIKTDTKMTPNISVNLLKTNMKRQLIELNLFRNQSVNEQHICYQRIGTRLYVFILIISLIILTIYSSIIKDINRETIFNPSESHYNELYQRYSNNLICPCTSLAISHEKFISIKVNYHQICTSEFIYPSWINYLLENENEYDSIRTNLGNQFNILRTLCEYSEQMMIDGLQVFLQAQFVTSQVIPKKIFQSQIDILIQQWQMNIINQCKHVIDLVRATNQGNKFINNYYNYQLIVNQTFGQVNFLPKYYSNCSCDFYENCSTPIFIDRSGNISLTHSENTTNWNFFIGCSAFESLLQTTLECFYNRTCVNSILSMKSGSENLTNISLLLLINNQSNEKIEKLIDQIMINSVVSNVSFSSYYNICHPNMCIIEKFDRRQTLVILMIVISVLGGLSTGLKILFLIGIKFFQKINENQSNCELRKLFLCSNKHQITSRLHVILIIILMISFYLISFLPSQIITVQISITTLKSYQNYLKEISEPIQCTCSQISFEYQTFLVVKPRFHQICSSDFISDQWISYIYQMNNRYSQLNSTDFRLTAVGQFQLLTSFCQISQRAINESLSQLLETAYINAQLVPLNVLNMRIQTLINEFQLKTSKSFLMTFNLLREITQTNKLISGYSTNWKFNNLNMNEYISSLHTISIDYTDCDCGLSSKCTQSSRGMKTGCYPLEALLQSTLQCFHDQQCIDINNTFKALNSSDIVTRFNLTSTIELILEELMIEEYSIDMSYEKYFNQCAPSSCSYSYNGHPNLIDIITSLIGLYGGLVIVSRWITLLIIEIYKYRMHQVHPDIS